MEMVSFAVSTGVGVSLVAGILSGVCYVLVYSKTSRKSTKKTSKAHSCAVCGEYFRSIDHILKGDSTVVCVKCQSKVCGQGCAREQQDEWICKNCLRPPETWFQGFLHSLQPGKISDDGDEKDSVESVGKGRNSNNVKVQVQDFIEKLVNSMLGQNIDDATITKIFSDENYLPLSGQQSPCTAHAALKQLIEKLLLEVLHMPALQRAQDSTISTSNAKDKTYEDLLATAILNKVISNSQARPSSSAASVSSRLSNNSNYKEDKEYFFGEETLDNKWRNADLETTSASSLEDWLQTDSSFGSRKYVDRVTLTIKQNIEELSQASDSDEDDRFNDSEYFTTKSAIWSDDEPNWFLQKRQFQGGTHSPVPVPMLVPNPTTEAKVLIGDKEVDETSDLSDVESEFGDTEIVPTRHSVLVDSKSIIGGKNILQNGVGRGGESGSESSVDSGVKEVGRNQSQYDTSDFAETLDSDSVKKTQNYAEDTPKTDIHVDDDNIEEETSLLSNYSNAEQEAEYIEYFSASLPRKVENKPQPPARPSLRTPKQPSRIIDKADSKNRNFLEHEYAYSDGDVNEFSGRYSRREKEKWKNAVEMKNNPYSKENIEKRINRSNSGVSSVFGPDYYAKLASSPSGTKSKSPKIFEEKTFSPHVEVDKRESTTSEAEHCYRAEPIFVDEAAQNGTEELQEYSQHSMVDQKPTETESNDDSIQYVAEVTSDSDLSYINCYDVTKSQVYKKPVDSEPAAQKITFVKNAKAQKQHKPAAKPAAVSATNYELKRHKSESDLYDLEETPKVLPRKKDNTLISKIYKVLSKSDLSEYPTFRTQLSTPDMHYFHSDNTNSFSSQDMDISNDVMTITKTMLLSSEDDYSDGTAFIRRPKAGNNYSSSEDALSFDETDGSNSISKGHKPRIGALATPAGAAFARNDAKSIEPIDETPKTPKTPAEPAVPSERNGANDSDGERFENAHSEVDELAKKRIVHNILDKLNCPRSNSNGVVSRESANEIIKESNEDVKMSVKELMKKFEANSGKNQVISSLTARSLSRHTKELLRE
ncbi:unnamed protein product [Phyllotreta striolata]|uniref:Uncharacterized protein n=1 Tax=Phyllotreta striolata TaxID=444603 RepID=A0A9N9XJA9_PHYSR|nr:unnamed protein product [Phyllotreta striolata]